MSEVDTSAEAVAAIKHAVTKALGDMGLDKIRSGEFFGMKQEKK